jgi:hypothetical protein
MLNSLKLIANRISFGTHVATVLDYLNWYRRAKDNTRMEKSSLFAEYIISACWRKMERRIGHWAAVGLIYNLSKLTPLMLSQWLPSLTVEDPATRQKDFRLSSYLLMLERSNSLEKIVKFHKYDIPSNAVQIGTEMKIVLPYLHQRFHNSPCNLYTKETVIEFHHLFVGTLLYYASSLRDLRKVHEDKKQGDTEIDSTIQAFIRSITDCEVKASKMKRSRREGDNVETSSESQILEALKNYFDGESNKTPSSPDEVTIEAMMEQKKKKLEWLANLKSYLGRELDASPSSPNEVMPEAAGKGKQTEKMKSELAKLKRYLDKLDEKWNAMPSSPDVVKPEVKPKDELHRLVRAVLASCRLLNAILGSGAFQRHIKFLVSNKLLTIPSDRYQKDYYNFSLEKKISWQQFRRTRTSVPLTVRESSNPDSEDGANNCDMDLEIDQDPFEIAHQDQIIMAIQGWMKLFVQHLHAKGVLESFARNREKEIPIEIKVYGIKSPKKPLPLPTWEVLDGIIRSSLQDKTPEEQDDVIKIFQSHVQSSDCHSSMAPTNNDNTAKAQTSGKGLLLGRNNIFSVIRDILTQEAKTKPRYYNIHCEVALASLVAASRSTLGVKSYAGEEFVTELSVGLQVILFFS